MTKPTTSRPHGPRTAKQYCYTQTATGHRASSSKVNQDATEPVVTGPQSAILPRLSADGAWILYLELSKTEGPSTPVRLMRIPVGGGAPQPVLQTQEEADYQCARAR